MDLLQEPKPLPPTMHTRKSGLDIETCAAATWQQWLGAGLVLNIFTLNSSSHFLKAFPPGWTSYEFPALRVCKTLVAITFNKFSKSSKSLLLKAVKSCVPYCPATGKTE